MSYFIFGLIDLNVPVLEALDADRIRALARDESMDAKLGSDVRQGLLGEMLEDDSSTTSVPFLLTRSSDDDTSDALISPYVVGIEGAAQSFTAVGRWLESVLNVSGVKRVRVWMTEGYDTAFEHRELRAHEFADAVATRVAAEGDVPSLLISVLR